MTLLPSTTNVISFCSSSSMRFVELVPARTTPRTTSCRSMTRGRWISFQLRLGLIVEGEKDHVPSMGSTTRFGSQQNAGVVGMLHGAVAEEKGQSFGFIALGKIDIQLFRSFENEPSE